MSRFLINLLLFVAVIGVIAYWFRGYSPQIRRAYVRLRDTVRFFRRARDLIRDTQGGRFNPQRSGGFETGFNPQDFKAKDFRKTVDVSASQVSTAQFKVVCPVCGDSLTEAQTIALRQRSVRCPGSSRVGQACPYYGKALN